MLAKPLILIVEDEPGIVDTLCYALATEGFEPACCGTGEAALQWLQREAAALVILDVGLPDFSGFELFKRIRERGADVPIIFLTARSDEIDRVVGLELGADDYVAKPFSPRELVARVRTVLRRAAKGAAAAGAPAGAAGAPPATAGASATAATAWATVPAAAPPPLDVDDNRRRIRYYGRALSLSRYEYGLLKTLAAKPGHVYTRDTLLAQVWDDPGDSFDRTVDAHVKTLRAKLKAIAPTLEPIRTHRGTGYAFADDLPSALPPG